MLKTINSISISMATALSLLLSSSALANEVYSETATGMVEVAVQAICDGDKERHLSMHQRKIEPDPYYDEKFSAFHEACKDKGIENIEIKSDIDDSLMQEQKRRYHINANIIMGDGSVFANTFRVFWGSTQEPESGNAIGAWRLGGISRVEVPILRENLLDN